MRACCQDSSPTTFWDALASQASSCLPHLCIHRAPAKIHRLRKLTLSHFPALAPITGIEVVRSKRKGMQSILFACHQCHFAARQLEQDTHRQELLAVGEGAWQESLATERPSPQVGLFYKAAHPLGPAKYKLQPKDHYQRIQCHRYPEKQHQEKATFLSVDVLLPGHPHAALTHRNRLLPFCHRSYADFLTCLSAGIKRLLKSLCSIFTFLCSLAHVGYKNNIVPPRSQRKAQGNVKNPKFIICYLSQFHSSGRTWIGIILIAGIWQH